MTAERLHFPETIPLGSMILKEPCHLHPDSQWQEHIPFAFWLVEHHQPKTIVELGVHTGPSYCAFCQAVAELKLETRCFGVDTFAGDIHTSFYEPKILEKLRAYHDPLYGGFSRLIESTFDEALGEFSDRSIDLLHIDGRHFYEDVKHEFETWLPKLSPRGIVVFHDTNERERGFGVFKLWAELEARYPSFEFFHQHGLGVLATGDDIAPAMRNFFSMEADNAEAVRRFFFLLGSRVTLKMQGQKVPKLAEIQRQPRQEIRRIKNELRHKSAEYNKLIRELQWKQMEIQRLEKRNALLENAVESAEKWGDDEWLQRMRHRWKPPHAFSIAGKAATARQIMETIAPWFDKEFYIVNYPDVAERGLDPLLHYHEHGEREGRKPCEEFDPVYYLASYPDVTNIQSDSALQLAFAAHPFFHYVATGKAEGRKGMPDSDPVDKKQEQDLDVAEYIMEAMEPWFDRNYYLSEYPDVAATGGDPLVHFYEKGEKEGRRPCADFDPEYYLAMNRDVKYLQSDNPLEAAFPIHPFFHYVVSGKQEGRITQPCLDAFHLEECAGPRDLPPEKTGIAIHLFYPDLWDEIQKIIGRFPAGTRLYINLVEGHSGHLEEMIREVHPNARIETRENRGRDVLPFLWQLKEMHGDGVQVALKIHTKKTTYAPANLGEKWRESLYGDLAPSAGYVNAIAKEFDLSPKTGVLIPLYHCFPLLGSIDKNRTAVEKLTARMGINLHEEDLGMIGFPAGTMFWFRPQALLPLTQLGLAADDFEEEAGQMDATLAHAVERMISFSARVAQFETRSYKLNPTPGHGNGAKSAAEPRNLDKKYTGITSATAVPAMEDLAKRLRAPVLTRVSDLKRSRLNLLLWDLDPEIVFGGYMAVLEFAAAMSKHHDVRFVLTGHPFARAKSLREKFEGNPRVSKVLKTAEFVDFCEADTALPAGKGDFFCAYSAWDCLLASKLARLCGQPGIFYLCQEDETSFHSHDAYHAMIAHAQTLPQFTIFNSTFLRDHFRQKRIGVYAAPAEHGDANSVVFNHALVATRPAAAENYRARKKCRILFYARPEAHAKRNLFEIGMLGLKEFLRQHTLSTGEVEFIGIGTLGYEAVLPLGGGHTIQIRPMLDLQSYSESLAGFDIGLSLIYAPHPGVLHFEMASAGLLAVTNTFGVRTASRLAAVSPNIIPVDATPEGIAEGLAVAWSRRGEYESRIRGANFTATRSWEEAYDDDFLGVINNRVSQLLA